METEDIWRDGRGILRLAPAPDAIDHGFRVLLSYAAEGLEDVIKFWVNAGTQIIR
jgi:hypothetical protein